MTNNKLALAALVGLTMVACNRGSDFGTDPMPDANDQEAVPGTEPVTEARLVRASEEVGNWLSHGRTYDEQRFSLLAEVRADNVSQLEGFIELLDRFDYWFDIVTPYRRDGLTFRGRSRLVERH